MNICRRMAASNCYEKKWIYTTKKKIVKEFLNGGFVSKGTEKETIINAIIVLLSYRIFCRLYRIKNKNDLKG